MNDECRSLWPLASKLRSLNNDEASLTSVTEDPLGQRRPLCSYGMEGDRHLYF